MNKLIKKVKNIPTNLEDLTKFVLIGKEKLIAVKAEIKAMKNLKFAESVYKQKEIEAKELGGALLLAKVRVGELLKEIPKESGGNRKSNKIKSNTGVTFETKEEKAEKLGFSKMDTSRFQQLADNKDIVEEVIKNSEDIPTQTECLKKIQEKKKPHVAQNTGDNEWYTPSKYIEAVRNVMGTIDLDPATSKIANEIVKADKIFTINDNGLDKKWFGNVFLNPPYSSDLVSKFIDKLIIEFKNIKQCILLVNNATDTIWFQNIVIHSTAVCFPKGRIKFYKPNSNKCAPLQGQCISYYGGEPYKFKHEFEQFGLCQVWS
jgi:phage N-6-adenine-methyltransferase